VLSHTEVAILNSIINLQTALGPRRRINIHDIAEASNYHHNTVWKLINALETKGALTRDTKPRHGTLYHILITLS
jgi:DNA-binding IclR family transcriptional regulator